MVKPFPLHNPHFTAPLPSQLLHISESAALRGADAYLTEEHALMQHTIAPKTAYRMAPSTRLPVCVAEFPCILSCFVMMMKSLLYRLI